MVSAVIRFLKDRRTWALILTGITAARESESKEVSLDSDDTRSVTVELKEGSKHTTTPTKEGK